MIQMLIGPIANVAGQFLKNRAEKVKAKQKKKQDKKKSLKVNKSFSFHFPSEEPD